MKFKTTSAILAALLFSIGAHGQQIQPSCATSAELPSCARILSTKKGTVTRVNESATGYNYSTGKWSNVEGTSNVVHKGEIEAQIGDVIYSVSIRSREIFGTAGNYFPAAVSGNEIKFLVPKKNKSIVLKLKITGTSMAEKQP